MKRTLLALALVAGCTPTVILGTLSVDGGSGVDLGGTCQVCDLGHGDLMDMADLSGFDGLVFDAAGGDLPDL